MKKIILTVAPVAGVSAPGANNPVSPEHIAREVAACARAGASQVHLHVRDAEGRQTDDLAAFSETLRLVRQQSDIIVQGSTGGVSNLSLEQRCTALQDPRVETASLNMGSCNFDEGVYINSLPDIRYWAGKMRSAQIKPELTIFDGGMMNNVRLLAEEGVLCPPFAYGFVLGVKGALPDTAYGLNFLQGLAPAGSLWGLIHAEREDLSLLAAAIGMGAGFVRVGFEDSPRCSVQRIAQSNVELVECTAGMIRSLGLEVASPAEAREILGLLPDRAAALN